MSTNNLIKYVKYSSNLKDESDFQVSDIVFKSLIDLAKENPLEFTCTVAQAFKEIKAEYDQKFKELDDAVGQVVVEMVKQGHATSKRV